MARLEFLGKLDCVSWVDTINLVRVFWENPQFTALVDPPDSCWNHLKALFMYSRSMENGMEVAATDRRPTRSVRSDQNDHILIKNGLKLETIQVIFMIF